MLQVLEATINLKSMGIFWILENHQYVNRTSNFLKKSNVETKMFFWILGIFLLNVPTLIPSSKRKIFFVVISRNKT